MIAALLVGVVGVLLVALPGVLVSQRRLPGAEWARISAVALLVGFVALESSLALLALPTILRVLHSMGLVSVCEHVLTSLAPGGELFGLTAVCAAAWVGARGVTSGWRAREAGRAAWVEPWLGRHENRGGYDLVVLPTERVLAMSVPARRPQVLISDGLLERLDAAEVDAVIRHEVTHQRFRHWRYVLLAVSVEGALRPLPFVSRSVRALRTAVEAWADEVAAGDTAAGRALIRRAILAVSRAQHRRRPVPADAVVLERALRLDRGRPPRTAGVRFFAHGPAIALGAALVVLFGSWVAGAHHALAFAGYCPH